MFCNIDVKYWTTSKGKHRGGTLAAGLMLALWLITFTLAVCPQFHQLLHHDAQNATHSCLITQVQQHLLTTGFVAVVVPAPPEAIVGSICFGEFQYLPTRDYRLSPSRAPPSVSSSIPVVG